MYFSNDKNDTDISSEFNSKNTKSFPNKYKLLITIAIAIILIIIMLLLFMNSEVVNYLELNGNEVITIYEDTDYVESGFKAYNSKDEDLTSEVVIESNLNTSEIGEYKITYTIGKTTKTRKVKIIAKPEEETYIYLTTINNSVNVYLKVGEKYTEPGYQVFSSSGIDLTDQVKVTGTVDTNKKGNYVLTYSVVDSNNVTISKTRTVVVMDTEISLTLTPEIYTNGNVTINVGIVDNYFDYLILPNGSKVMSSTYEYQVSENGKYTFKVYNTKGISKEASIEVRNIDKDKPSGSCVLKSDMNGSYIIINASDVSGIKHYVYNGKSYSNNKINLDAFVSDVKVVIYDNANNKNEITCSIESSPLILNVDKDGVIIKVNVKKVDSNISGYYFSYTSERPSKTGGYIATSDNTLEVVRLPGTTYIWAEDESGRISNYKTVTIATDDLLNASSKGKTILQGTKLSAFLASHSYSLEQLNNLIARSVRAAGLYTGEAAATSGVTLITVLAQKFGIKLPYWMGGKPMNYGANGSWGMYYDNPTYEGYYYYGMDCDGFTNWTYINAGLDVDIYNNHYWYWERVPFSKEEGEIGDIISQYEPNNHVKIIVGKTDTGFIVAHANGKSNGIWINIHPYTDTKNYTIIKGSLLLDRYSKVSSSEYPSGF